MSVPNIQILSTTVNILRERNLGVHAQAVEDCIQYIELKEAGIPIETPTTEIVLTAVEINKVEEGETDGNSDED